MTSAVSGAAAGDPVEPRPPLVSVRGLGIRHDGATTWSPADASFDIAPGEVVLLLGPSGAGKSTLTLALDEHGFVLGQHQARAGGVKQVLN